MDKKPLGMQTILDLTVKDLLVIYVFNDITTWFVVVNFIEQSYGHYASIMIVAVSFYVIKVFILQLIVATIIRYFCIFHNTVLNNFEEDKIIKFARIFIGIVSLILTMFEDLEHGVSYALLMNQPIQKEKLEDLNCLKILLILGLGKVSNKMSMTFLHFKQISHY